ncbi:MAG: RNase adaptor protein RapZ, partial [Acidobacteria bacterium]|nr:RNase adaptor protein RapZ [Acidobacteriota bacterium]
PEFHDLSGRHRSVVKYIRSFPQTEEVTKRLSELLAYLIPHYIREGKNYLTISFGCTGGRHRSVMMAETIGKILAGRGFRTKIVHRDVAK